MDQAPVAVQVHGPRLDAEALESNVGPQCFGADLWVEQDALVLRAFGTLGLPVSQVGEELLEVVGMQLSAITLPR